MKNRLTNAASNDRFTTSTGFVPGQSSAEKRSKKKPSVNRIKAEYTIISAITMRINQPCCDFICLSEARY